MITAPLLLVGGLATTSATTRASATSPPPMSTTAAGTRSWPKERRSQTGPYSNDGTTIGPAGSERRPPRCPLTKGPKSPKVADDVHSRAASAYNLHQDSSQNDCSEREQTEPAFQRQAR